MNATERKAIMLKHRDNHIAQLKKLGYIYNTMNAIKMVEHQASWYATEECNGTITEEEAEQAFTRIETRVKRLFGGALPHGFFINGDPRGYALKLDDEAYSRDPKDANYMPLTYTDMGGYGILAPEEF